MARRCGMAAQRDRAAARPHPAASESPRPTLRWASYVNERAWVSGGPRDAGSSPIVCRLTQAGGQSTVDG